MASSQPDDEGNEMTDSPETHRDNSEDRPDDVDSEEEISPEQDSDDDDEELDTRGCVPDSEDHVEAESEDEENEGDDYEDDDGDDSNKLIIAQPTISESSGLANLSRQTTSDLEPEDVCLERFDRRLANATKFMKIKTDEADWNETMSPETRVYRGFKQAMERSSAERITEIFKKVIPKSTRAILGRSNLTHEDIMALPLLDNSVARPGVYVICLTKSEDQHPGVSDEESTDSPSDERPEVPDKESTDSPSDERPEESTNSPMDERPEESTTSPSEERPEVPQGVLIDFTTDEHPKVPNGLYTGSSIKSLSERYVYHRAQYTKIVGTKLLDDRRLPNKQIMLYVYCYAKKYGLVPSYRRIAIFPKQLEGIDFPHADTRWLVRTLEHVVTLLLGTYGPSQTNPWNHRYGYTEEMYLATLAQCEIPLGIFHPLNHAMPLKQKCGWTVGARVCQNCESLTTGANGWYYAPDACEVAVLYNCSACYWYRFRNGTARPPELFIGLKARPTSGPCSNCQATESAQWEWHPRDKDHVICSKCRSHWVKYATDRPPKKQKYCSDCGATTIKGHFHRASDLNGKKNGQYWCATCAMRRQRRRDREARENKHSNLTCLICGNSNPPAWRTYRTCMPCWEKSNAEKRFRKTRERKNCWQCHRSFQKQTHNPLSKEDWRDVRKWHPALKEWICKDCHYQCEKKGSFGIKASDLEGFEIRCEDCHTLYAKTWTTLGKKWLDRTDDTTLTWDRIICGNCYQKRNTISLRKSRRKAKNKAKGKGKRKGKTVPSAKLEFKDNRGNARKAGEETWQEKKGKKVKQNRPFPQTKLLLSYLLRVHGKDFRADGIIAEKVANDNLEASL